MAHKHSFRPMLKEITTIISIAATIIMMVFFISAGKKINKKSAPDLPPPTISPVIPGDVLIPGNFGGLPIAFFDDYSWKTFIALVWPAKAGQRGVADAVKSLADPSPRVFETFKSDWEIFHPDGSAPSADWNSFGDPVPCSITGNFGFDDVALVSTSKFGNLGQAGFGNLVGPIIAQNKTYVRYLTSFNQAEFTSIVNNKLYLQANLNNVTLPVGSIDIKTSWIDMQNISHPERYYTRQAWIFDLSDSTCKKILVGLVGMHIVQKTPTRPQWIWSSFEQVDNTKEDGAIPSFTFHDGTAAQMPSVNPVAFPPPVTAPDAFNIQRLLAIHQSTVATNALYQQALKDNGNSVWQFYKLVMTQWPIPVSSPTTLGTPAFTFPGNGANSSFSNLTMETFDQKRIQTGCMNCHNSVKASADFLWSLKVNAFPSIFTQATGHPLNFANPSNFKTKPIKDKSIQQLKSLLQSTKN